MDSPALKDQNREAMAGGRTGRKCLSALMARAEKLEPMTPEEKLEIPIMMSLRRMSAALVEMQAKYSALEQRIVELESKHIHETAAQAA